MKLMRHKVNKQTTRNNLNKAFEFLESGQLTVQEIENMNEVMIIDVGMCTLAKCKNTIVEYRELIAVYKKSKSKIGSRFVKVYPNFHINIFDEQNIG